MLSKEEIEKAKEDFNFCNEGDYITKEMSDSKNVLLNYIDKLESREQKLIEKLEEDTNKPIPLAEDMGWVKCRKEYAKEILEILKKE